MPYYLIAIIINSDVLTLIWCKLFQCHKIFKHVFVKVPLSGICLGCLNLYKFLGGHLDRKTLFQMDVSCTGNFVDDLDHF